MEKERAITAQISERERLGTDLAGLGFRVCRSDANFILFFSDREIERPLAAQGILVRNCANYHGLEQGWYRIAVKQKPENDLLISALRKIIGG